MIERIDENILLTDDINKPLSNKKSRNLAASLLLYSSIGKLPKSSITYLMFLLAARTNILSLPSPFYFR